MKAVMDANGTITLSAESPLEAFALRQWAEKSICTDADGGCRYVRTSMLLVDMAWPPGNHPRNTPAGGTANPHA